MGKDRSMKLRLWPKREQAAEPEPAPAPGDPEPVVEPEPAPVVEEQPPAAAAPEPVAPGPSGPPESVSMTIDEAKAVIKAAQGDVIQIGFLTSAYQRHREEDPGSAETAAARKRLAELVGKRLKDRDLLAASGSFELRE